MKTTHWTEVFVNYHNSVARAKLCYNYYSEPIQTFRTERKNVLAFEVSWLLFIHNCIETNLIATGPHYFCN